MPPRAAAVVLAAGASSRLGQPKQLIQVAGETLLERSIRIAREAGCAPVVVVLGAGSDEVSARCSLTDAIVVVNFDWEEGMASSIRAGLAALESVITGQPGDCHGVLLMTCDQPAVTPGHLRALMASGALTASAYAGRRGVPAYFPAANLSALQRLSGDSGARSLLRAASAIELPGGELDIDTPADLALLRPTG
jgi:molybdenum cofactor cytidylyltransferase